MNDAASAAPSAREKFEAWLHDNFGKRSTVRAPDGYAHSVAHAALPSTYASVQMLWEAWQAACRAHPTPSAVVEPLTADGMMEPQNGQQWRVEWWNESCRMMLPKDSRLDSFQVYKNGTLMFTIKKGGSNA